MVFVFGSQQEAFDGVSSFVMYLYPMFLHTSFMLLQRLLTYGSTMYGFWSPDVPFVWMLHSFFCSCLEGALIFIFTLIRAQTGYLFSIRTFCRSSSFKSCFGLNTQLWPCGEAYSPHCIWLQWYDGCPIAGTNLYGLVFYTLWYSNCHLILV